MNRNELAGTGAVIRLILRRDRLLLPIWITLPPLFVILVAAAFAQLYPTAESQQMVTAQLINSPGFVALLGPITAPTIGGLTVWRSTIFAGLVVAGGNALTVIRHTRSDEETGRYELLGSGAVGRRAPLAGSLVVTLGADVLIAALVAAGLIAYGLPVAGSVAFGVSVAAMGWTFAALAGAVAQLTESAGMARGIVGAFFVLFYVLRAVGDGKEPSGQSWLSWSSPLAWVHLIEPFATIRWGAFALFIGMFLVLAAAAFALSSRRDAGAGIFVPRRGPARASHRLHGPLALAWRLQRRTLLASAVLLALLGVVIGYLAESSADLLASNMQLAKLYAVLGGASAYTDALFTFSLTFTGWIAAAYAIAATLRLRSEEVENHVEHVLAAAVSRLRWASSNLVLVLIGSAVVLAAFGLLAGLTYGLTAGNVSYQLPRVLLATMAYLPAVWVMAGIAMALYGLLPRFSVISWGALGAVVGVEIIGGTLQVSQSILNVSPFNHVPKVLADGLSLWPLASLTVVGFALIGIGLVGFRRRSIG
jgi:polyether ionophore transport system permease protein